MNRYIAHHGGYRTVVEAKNLEEVFAKLNRGSGCEIEFNGPSLSVGDTVRDMTTNKLFLCESFGWKEVTP